ARPASQGGGRGRRDPRAARVRARARLRLRARLALLARARRVAISPIPRRRPRRRAAHYQGSERMRLGLLLLCLFLTPLATAAEHLTLGVFPRLKPTEMVRSYQPLATYLGERLGRTV